MTDTNIHNSNRIGRHPGKKGPRSPVRNQTGLEKSATGTNSSHQESEESHAEIKSQMAFNDQKTLPLNQTELNGPGKST